MAGRRPSVSDLTVTGGAGASGIELGQQVSRTHGGGLALADANPIIDHVELKSNRADRGGRIWNDMGAYGGPDADHQTTWIRSRLKMDIPEGFKRSLAAKKLKPGNVTQVKVSGKTLVVANIDGQFHAMEGHCPHAGGELGGGRLRGTKVVCPLHFWPIDFMTGGCNRAPGLLLDRFEAREIDGYVYIKA